MRNEIPRGYFHIVLVTVAIICPHHVEKKYMVKFAERAALRTPHCCLIAMLSGVIDDKS